MRRRALSMMFLIGALGAASFAQGESPAELRQEAERLTRENQAIQSELDALRARLDAMIRENEALRRLLAARGTTAPSVGAPSGSPGGQAGGIAADPYSSPDALFVALLLDYAEHRDAAAPSEEDAESERRRVRAWTQGVPRRFTGTGEWLTRVEFVEREDPREPYKAWVTVLHPGTLEAIGEPPLLEIPERFAVRMLKGPAKDAPAASSTLWQLRVQMQARPVFDRERDEAGPFDYPRFLGPYAGFGYRVDLLGINALSEDEARRRAGAGLDEAGEPVDR